MQANSWVLTDRYNEVVVIFEDGRFNETQHISPLNDTISENFNVGDMAQIMKEIGEWARRYHSSKCFSQTYGFEYDEDERLCLYRRKSPQWRLYITDESQFNKLPSTLRKAAEFLNKGQANG